MATDTPKNAAPLRTTGETVTVGCKLPNGLNLGHDVHGPDAPVVILNGANHPNAIAGTGLTHGIDKAGFEKWLKDHGGPDGIPAIRHGLIFAYDKPGQAVSAAKERKKTKTGFEGLDPDKPAADLKPDDGQDKRNAEAAAAAAEREETAERAAASLP